MNWSDYAVIALIAVFAIIGLKKGFVMSVFRVVSFIVCIYASMKFYPVLEEILEKTPIYDSIKKAVVKTLLMQGHEVSASSAASATGTAGAQAVINPLPLPDFFKKFMLQKLPSPSKLIDLQGITNALGDELTKMVISIISLIALYIILRFVMAFIGIILKGISRLPVFKQIDKSGGFILGVIQGILAVFLLCSILLLFNTNLKFAPIFSTLDKSLFAGWFYDNNFIIKWMFPTAVL